ncbi:MAG: ornithine cyclodeaminase family protein [Spirochaetota bacterium]|nr:ornithine cyclodeaminase family protein [Spirochaetota bacterium]
MKMSTYIIQRSKIEQVFNMNDYLTTVERAFILYGEGKMQMPPKEYLYFDKGDMRCMPVHIPSMKIAGVKNVTVHPNNKDMPVVMATITLIDPDTGYPLAIMDGTHITKMRTGAAGGIAAKYLSREDSEIATFIGTGDQARTQLKALLIARPRISKIIAYDVSKDSMKDFAQMVNNEYGLDAEYTLSVDEAAGKADIITTTTPVRTPIVKAEHIRKGVHINAIGADARGKQELDFEVLTQSRIIIDNWEQSSHSGEINVAVSKEVITQKDIYGDIGEIVTGQKPGRESSDQKTIFDSTGLAIQDITAAFEIYRRIIIDKRDLSKLVKIDLI